MTDVRNFAPHGARRTQQARTAAMQVRLLDATIACLAESGFARLTTTEVVRRAGVSRGAQVHHFPTKVELVLAAIDHVLARRQQEFHDAFASLPAEERSLSRALDLLWDIYQRPSFVAWLELAVAARADEELHARLVDVEQRFGDRSQALFDEFFPNSPDDDFSHQAVALSFTLLDGLGMQRALGLESDPDGVLQLLKGLADLFAPAIGGTP